MEYIISVITISSVCRFAIETCEFIKYANIRHKWYQRVSQLFMYEPEHQQLTIFSTDDEGWTDINTDWILINNN